jgi:hypothetical protein
MPGHPDRSQRDRSANPDGGAAPDRADPERAEPDPDRCDICGSDRVSWRNCKLICTNCRSIVKSCADL